jgi:sarcosine oxidase, subunit beta
MLMFRSVLTVERASVVIVGGGVIGASVAFHLAEAGVEDVLLVERAELGSGSTAKGAGGVRAMFSDELNVRIGLRSLEAWGAFGERPGWEIDLRRVGYLFLLSTPEHVAEFERSVEMQNRLGLPSRMVSVGEAAELSPLAGMEGVLAGAFCPLAGYATPDGAVQGYATGARGYGLRIETHAKVTGIEPGAVAIERRGGTRGTIETDCVICAAGPWSREVGAMAGVDLAVTPERRRIAHTGPLPMDGEPPMTIDFATGFYFHREGAALALGGREQTLEELAPIAARRLPSLEELGIRSSWWGWYEMSPDHNALIGTAREPEGLFYATGFSGHGFQQGPVVGEHLAQLALGLEPTFDLSELSVERFATGAVRREQNVI